MASSKLPSTTLPNPVVIGVNVTFAGPPTTTYAPGLGLMTKRAGETLATDGPPPKPRNPPPPPLPPAPSPMLGPTDKVYSPSFNRCGGALVSSVGDSSAIVPLP